MCGLVFLGTQKKTNDIRNGTLTYWLEYSLYYTYWATYLRLSFNDHLFAHEYSPTTRWIFTAWLTYATIVQSHYFIGNAQNAVSVITKRLSASNIMCVSVMATKNTHNIPTDEVIFYSLFRPNIVEWLYALGIHNWHLSGSKIRHMYTPLLIYNLSILLWPILALA